MFDTTPYTERVTTASGTSTGVVVINNGSGLHIGTRGSLTSVNGVAVIYVVVASVIGNTVALEQLVDGLSVVPDLRAFAAGAKLAIPAQILPNEVELHSPDAPTLQSAIDYCASRASSSLIRSIKVFGTVSLETTVELKSYVHLDLGSSIIKTTTTPDISLVDNGAENCLFKAEHVRDVTPFSYLDANTSDGAYRLTLEGAAGATLAAAISARLVAAPRDTYVELTGVQNMAALIEPGAEVTEILAVDAVVGSTVFTKSPLKFTRNKNGDEVFGRPRVYLCATVPKDIVVIGGRFDCTGKNVADAIYLKGARDITIRGQQGKGFSRTFLELQGGCEGVEFRDYYARGACNANFLFESAHNWTVAGARSDLDGDWLHPQGNPRAWGTIAKTCTSGRIRDSHIGKHGRGLRIFGGRHINIDNVTIEACNTMKFNGRIEGDDGNFIAKGGPAIATGAVTIGPDSGYRDEFSLDLTIGKLTIINCRSHAPDVAAAFFHDVRGLTVGEINISNVRETPDGDYDGDALQDYYGGVEISDCFEGVKIESIIVRGAGFGLCIEQSATALHLGYLMYSSLTSSTFMPAGRAIRYATVGSLHPEYIELLEMGDGNDVLELPGSSTINPNFSIGRIRWGNVGVGRVVGPVYMADLSEGAAPASGAGCLLEVDTTTPLNGRRVKNAGIQAGVDGKWVFLDQAVAGTGTVVLVTPVVPDPRYHGIALVVDSTAVSFNDKLVQLGTSGKWTVDNDATNGFFWARSKKDAAGEAQVYYAARAA